MPLSRNLRHVVQQCAAASFSSFVSLIYFRHSSRLHHRMRQLMTIFVRSSLQWGKQRVRVGCSPYLGFDKHARSSAVHGRLSSPYDLGTILAFSWLVIPENGQPNVNHCCEIHPAGLQPFARIHTGRACCHRCVSWHPGWHCLSGLRQSSNQGKP